MERIVSGVISPRAATSTSASRSVAVPSMTASVFRIAETGSESDDRWIAAPGPKSGQLSYD